VSDAWFHPKFSFLSGNCVYGFLMGTVNLILIVESIRTVATHSSEEETNAIHIPALAAVSTS
jgi:hypothetical protein